MYHRSIVLAIGYRARTGLALGADITMIFAVSWKA